MSMNKHKKPIKVLKTVIINLSVSENESIEIWHTSNLKFRNHILPMSYLHSLF